MTEAEWQGCDDPGRMLEFLRGKASDRRLRLFASACCHRLAPLLHSNQSRWFCGAMLSLEEALESGATDPALGHDHPAEPRQLADVIRTIRGADAQRAAELTAKTTAEMAGWATDEWRLRAERTVQARRLRDVFGNPFRPVAFSQEWRTDTAVTLARTMYESRDFSAMPILADALQDAGCDNDDILSHARGCWVVDLVLGKE